MDKDISIGVGFFSFLKVGGNKVIGENLRERERESVVGLGISFFSFSKGKKISSFLFILGCVHLSGYKG
jgi:hypothetical protein